MRNSRYVLRKGPLVVYGDENNLVKRTARNLPGVDVVNVHRLNLLHLAPGGHLGRFIIWTKDAFKALNDIFGTYRRRGVEKGGYQLARHSITCADLARLINSDQVQSKLRQVKTHSRVHDLQKRNPLKNRALMKKLNPFDATRRLQEQKAKDEAHKKRLAGIKAARKAHKKARNNRRKTFQALNQGLVDSFKHAEDEWKRVEAAGLDKQESEEEDDE